VSAPRWILASASPRRRALLAETGLAFEVIPAAIDEIIVPGEAPESAAARLASEKARIVARGMGSAAIVLGSDTVVAVDGEILGKPVDAEDARRMLRRLSSRPHRVVTGVCLVEMPAGREVVGRAVTAVFMRAMADEEIDAYVASGESFGKAGAYAIQETGDRFVVRIEGDYDNVVGLPIRLVRDLAAALGHPLP